MEGTAGDEQSGADAASEERFVTGYTGRMFVGMSVGWGAIAFGREILPPLLPAIIGDLGITSFQAGAALTALWLMRALNQYPGGRLADQLSRKTVLVGALVVGVGGFALLSGAVAYPLFLAGAVLVGVAAGAYSVSVRTATADLFTAKRGKAFGLQNSFAEIASVGATGGAVVVLAAGTWRGAFLPLAAFLGLVALGLHVWDRDRYAVHRVEMDVRATGRRVFHNPETRLVTAAFVFYLFALLGLLGFLPTFLQAEKSLSPNLASASYALVFLTGMVAAPTAGTVADRVGTIPTVMGTLVLGAAGLAALLLAESLLALAASIVLTSVGLRSFLPVGQAHLLNTFPDDTMGGDFGGVKTVYGVLGSLGPSYVGWVAGRATYTLAYLGLIACLLVSLAFVALVARRS